MLPPGERSAAYADGDVDALQAVITSIASRVVFTAGMPSLSIDLPLLSAVSSRRFVALYLSLVLAICLVVLFALAAMVVYSILTVSVASRRFEIGVRRMLGATRPALVALLVVQSLLYALPGWILGLALAAALSGQLTQQLAVTSASGETGSATSGSATGAQVLSGSAVAAATALALAVPAVAALGPIRTAVSRSIREGLDSAGKGGGGGGGGGSSGGIEYNVERAGTGRPAKPLLALGLIGFAAGLALYYLLPLALLSLDLGIFLGLFLCVFVGMLGGAATLGLNIQGILQRGFACLLLSWWERGPVLRLAVSNLGAHASRNRLTSLMYGVAVAFVVFAATVSQQQLQATSFEAFAEAGSAVYAIASDTSGSDFSTSSGSQDGRARGPSAGSALVARPSTSTWRFRGNESDSGFARMWESSSATSSWGAGLGLAGSEEALLAELVRLQSMSVSASASASASASSAPNSTAEQPSPSVSGVPADVTVAVADGQTDTAVSSRAGVGWAWSFRPLSEWGSPPAAAWSAVHLPADRHVPAIAATLPAAGPEALDPSERSALLFPEMGTLGRTSASSIDPFPVSPGLFASHPSGFVVVAGQDSAPPDATAVSPEAASVTAAESSKTQPQTDAAGAGATAKGSTWVESGSAWSDASRGRPRPATLAPSLADRGGETASTSLYSAWGSSGAAVSGGFGLSMWVAPGAPVSLQTSDAASSPAVSRSRLGVASLLDAAPQMELGRTSTGSSAVVSAPLALRLAAERGAALPAALVEPARLFPVLPPSAAAAAAAIAGGRVASAKGSAEIDSIRDAMSAARPSYEWMVVDVREDVDNLGAALAALDLVFAALTAAAMALCFFSLSSAMSTNVLEQSREVGVLLALGLRGRALVRAYVHEAALLVGSASVTGLGIGLACAWTFGQQRALFTAQTVPLPVPWPTVGVVIVGSALCGVIAACAPATRLVGQPITKLLRNG
ncbi:hypothetical protein FNF27_07746 [Cafeteria roenbergensis]|uniref:ABC3 transporter permease C-terminal domain-containing protein n=1 Tax=Cafeteria roenbergensis TaxID=33653 RepID=A0A5A8DHT5_CAFRO|nr:hypothetical protein FNF27_07746 [Cafeteria roenbergensis]